MFLSWRCIDGCIFICTFFIENSSSAKVVNLENCVTGSRVKRGPNWNLEDFGEDDYVNGKPGLGTIEDCGLNSYAKVKWDNGHLSKYYSIGAVRQYHLYFADEMRK